MGVPLYKLKDIRLLYGENPWPTSPIPFGEYVILLNCVNFKLLTCNTNFYNFFDLYFYFILYIFMF